MLAILSDTHLPRGRRELPAACVALLEQAEAIVHAGDLTTFPVLAHLRAIAPVVAVHGNVDDWEVRSVLPERVVAEVAGLRVGVVHDAGPAGGRHDRLRAAFPGCDVVVYGHSHLPELARVEGCWIVNPGSPTERRRAPEHSMVVVREGVPELVPLGP